MDTKTLMFQFKVSEIVLRKVADGLSHEDALKAPANDGNCANWILGHIVQARNSIMPMLGKEPVFPDEKFERHGNGTEPIKSADEALPFEELYAAYNKIHPLFMEGLSELTADALAAKAPFSPLNDPNETVGSLLAGIAFHEAYHVGQTALLRRVAGKPGPVG